MSDVFNEYLNFESIVVCFEAYKLLEKYFTAIMKSLLGMKEH
jgi:hypothetical protein